MSPMPNQNVPNPLGLPEEFPVSTSQVRHGESPVPSPSGLAMLLMSSPWQATGDAASRAIADRDLLFYIRGRLLRRLTIVQTELGSYRLRVSLKWDRHEYVLSGAAGKPLEWSSLDGVAKQIQCRYTSTACVALSLSNTASQDPREIDDDALGISMRREPAVDLQAGTARYLSAPDRAAQQSGPSL